MVPHSTLNYTKCVVIVHGKSEFTKYKYISGELFEGHPLYEYIVPISLSVDTVNEVRTFAKKIKGIKETDMLAFVEYCFRQMPGEEL